MHACFIHSFLRHECVQMLIYYHHMLLEVIGHDYSECCLVMFCSWWWSAGRYCSLCLLCIFHYYIFCLLHTSQGWPKKAETFRRIATCLYLLLSDHNAAVGIYVMIHYHLYHILQVKVHWSSDHKLKWLLCSFCISHASCDSLQILQAGAGMVSDHFHISLFIIHLSYRSTLYNIHV